MAKENIIASGTGRRKTAVAYVKLVKGEGKWLVNKTELAAYIPSEALQAYLKQPIAISGYDLSAIRHGLARALCEADAGLRAALKKAGCLTRDSRMKERKKPGQPGARKRFQFSKR